MSIESSTQGEVYLQIQKRLQQQLDRVASGDLPWCMLSAGIDPLEKLAVLVGETGEVGDAVQARYRGTARDNLDAELLDVAACAVGWLMANAQQAKRAES